MFEEKRIEAFHIVSEMSTLRRSDSFRSAHTNYSPAPYDFGRKSPFDCLYGSQNKCLLWVEWVGPATDYDPADNVGVAGFHQRCVIAVPPPRPKSRFRMPKAMNYQPSVDLDRYLR